MTDYGRYILEEVPTIKEKNELIKNSKLDFKSFNEYRFTLQQIEHFDINQNCSDNEVIRKMNKFIFQMDKTLENIIEKNELRIKPRFDYTLSEDILFYEALKQIKLFGQKENFTKDELANFLQELKELVMNKKFEPSQEEILDRSIELFQEELLQILDSSNVENSQINNETYVDTNKTHRRQH